MIIAVFLFHFIKLDSQTGTTLVSSQAASAHVISCLHPANALEQERCKELEKSILDVTVIIEMQFQLYIQGHRHVQLIHSNATTMAGRYLVTHNHYDFSLTVPASEGQNGYIAISLRRSDGELILDSAPLSVFTIVYEDPATLVLNFSNTQEVGLFDFDELPSVNFASWDEIQIDIGTELAQVDWNGNTPYVVWTQVNTLPQAEGVLQIQVDHFVQPGSSGGGIFLHGQHIGNNWARYTERDKFTGEVYLRTSIIALNSAALVQLN